MTLRFYPTYTTRLLSSITTRFYEENAASFSATRSRPWDGWRELASFLRGRGWGDGGHSVLDIACGNLRFEKFLAEAFPSEQLDFTCMDSCAELVQPHLDELGKLGVRVSFCETNIVEMLSEAGRLPLNEKFDFVVSFGFMHHIPGSGLRARALEQMVELARPGGIVAVSLWRFADDPRFREKAEREHAEAFASLDSIAHVPSALDLEHGDYLLGWNRMSNAFRYCHSFDDEEVAELLQRVSPTAQPVHRYRADGRTGDANEYLLFTRR